MVKTPPSPSDTCSYCGAPVEDERAYREHLYDAHDPSELGTIDRRRYERYDPAPNAVVRTGKRAADGLGRLRYPIDVETMAVYAVYGALSSLVVATALGVGL